MKNFFTNINKLRMLLLVFVLSISAQTWADQGYAVLTGDAPNQTLTFYYGTPTGTEGTDYFLTDDTGSSNPVWYSNCTNITSVVFDSSFADARPVSCYNWFGGCSNLTSITGMEYLNTSEVTQMAGMFSSCSSLTTLDLRSFDMSNVTNPSFMFYNCSSLTTIYCNDNWSSLSNSSMMFYGCTSLYSASSGMSFDSSKTNATYANPTSGYFTGDYPKVIWCAGNTTLYFLCDVLTYAAGDKYDEQFITEVHKITSKSSAYSAWNSYSDATIANNATHVVIEQSFSKFQPTSCSNWFGVNGFKELVDITGMEYLNTSDVTNMSSMFSNCKKLTSVDVSHFDTRKVTNMSYMFQRCEKLTALDVSNWKTSMVTNMNWMFKDCNELTTLGTGNVGQWNTSKVTLMGYMFNGCKKLEKLDVSGWDVSKVTNMGCMFYDCIGLTTLDVSNWTPSSATDMSYLFRGCRNLAALDVSNWNTSSATNMSALFNVCEKLTTLDVSNWNTSQVTNMSYMFSGCSGLTSLDVSNFDTGNVTNISSMFYGCSGLTSLDVSGFNTAKVTNMLAMFRECTNLSSLDVSGFDTGNVTNMENMFYGCSKLTHLTFGENFSTASASSKSGVFAYCPKLRYLDFYDSDMTDMTSVKRSDSSNMFYGVPRTTVIYRPHDAYKKEITGYTAGTHPSPILEDGDYTENVVYYQTTTLIPPPPYVQSSTPTIYCDAYYSVDKVDIEFPRAFRAARAEYSRDMTGKTYGSVILPYAFDSNEDIQAYTLSSSKGENQLTFAKAATVPAHTPFVFKKLGNATLLMTSADYAIIVKATRSTNAVEDTWDETTNYKGAPYEVATSLSGWKSLGYYIKEDVTDYDGLYFVQNDKFRAADGTLNLYDHRVLFRPDAAGAAKTFILTFVDDAAVTAIDAAEIEDGAVDAAVYDASGRRMDKVRCGMNIVRMSDGTVRKVVVR